MDAASFTALINAIHFHPIASVAALALAALAVNVGSGIKRRRADKRQPPKDPSCP